MIELTEGHFARPAENRKACEVWNNAALGETDQRMAGGKHDAKSKWRSKTKATVTELVKRRGNSSTYFKHFRKDVRKVFRDQDLDCVRVVKASAVRGVNLEVDCSAKPYRTLLRRKNGEFRKSLKEFEQFQSSVQRGVWITHIPKASALSEPRPPEKFVWQDWL